MYVYMLYGYNLDPVILCFSCCFLIYFYWLQKQEKELWIMFLYTFFFFSFYNDFWIWLFAWRWEFNSFFFNCLEVRIFFFFFCLKVKNYRRWNRSEKEKNGEACEIEKCRTLTVIISVMIIVFKWV